MASHRGFLSLLKAASPFRKALINSNFSRGPASLRRTATRPLFHWPGICKDLKVNNHCTFEWFVSKTVFVDYTQGYSSQVKKTKWMGTVLLNRSKVGWFQCKLHDVAWSIMKLPQVLWANFSPSNHFCRLCALIHLWLAGDATPCTATHNEVGDVRLQGRKWGPEAFSFRVWLCLSILLFDCFLRFLTCFLLFACRFDIYTMDCFLLLLVKSLWIRIGLSLGWRVEASRVSPMKLPARLAPQIG